MYKLVINSPKDILAAVRQQMTKQTRPTMVKNFRARIEPVGQWAVGELAQEPTARKVPGLWQSIKQRKAYFASNGFGGGIPYKRTHSLSQGWKTVFRLTTQREAEWALFNDNPSTRFVQGDDVQIFHVDRWIQPQSIAGELQERVDNATIDAWFETCETVTTV